jgi:hypothetical protein
MDSCSWAWWYKPVVSALRRQRQEDGRFQASPGYIVRFDLKKRKALTKSPNELLGGQFRSKPEHCLFRGRRHILVCIYLHVSVEVSIFPESSELSNLHIQIFCAKARWEFSFFSSPSSRIPGCVHPLTFILVTFPWSHSSLDVCHTWSKAPQAWSPDDH